MRGRPASHQAVAQIHEASSGHIGHQQRLFETHRMAAANLFFQQRSGPDVGSRAKGCAIQQSGLADPSAVDLDIAAELAAIQRHRCFPAQFAAGADTGSGAAEAAAGVDRDIRCDATGNDLVCDPHLLGSRQPYAAIQQAANGFGCVNHLRWIASNGCQPHGHGHSAVSLNINTGKAQTFTTANLLLSLLSAWFTAGFIA